MPRAEKDARRLKVSDRRRVIAAIERFATRLEGNVVKLSAIEPAEYILRVLPRDKAYRVREETAKYAGGLV